MILKNPHGRMETFMSDLFNFIAPVYGLFYEMQKKHYKTILKRVSKEFDLTCYMSILDVGCGTGALCSVLHDRSYQVTGIDPAKKMLKIAMRQPENKEIQFLQGNVLDGLPFEDKTFDLSIASYVAHGLQKGDRERMYAEMCRVSKMNVIIYDYNQKRGLLTTLVEWFEGGDYFNFIKTAKVEMEECMIEMNRCFSDVRVLNVDERAAWYICTPK